MVVIRLVEGAVADGGVVGAAVVGAAVVGAAVVGAAVGLGVSEKERVTRNYVFVHA